ncbi:MAG TPA: SpoIID/LytB domain-containing protein [Acidimicrobiales bacterium]|nr:SpoIID/LytB domain-containing protein [Acidimicrobiales bacterium]
MTGHGWGHGRGMGQWGALGYAIDHGWTYHQILDHYYGGTVAGQAPAGTVMTVDLTRFDGQDTIVYQSQGKLGMAPAAGVACAAGSPCAVRITRTGAGTWSIYKGTACSGGAGGWVLATASFAGPNVGVLATAGPSDNVADMLEVCEASGARTLRGDVWATDTGTSQATVNHLPLESYVRGVVPNESPASWGALGGGQGEQELMAQAVAARSYALAASYSAWAKTCDSTTCQVYRGRAFQGNDGSYVDLEGTPAFSASDQAVASTAGEVRLSAASGAAALTEYSASTGGYTAGGTFPAVPDDGDATAANPNHTWTATVAASDIEAAFGPSLGALQSVEVTARNGLGDLGGRVTSVTVHFANGNATVSGSAFAGALGLRSNWFAVGGGVTAPAPAPPPPPPPAGYHVLTADGSVFAFQGAKGFGSLIAAYAGTTAVGLAEVTGGYWVLGANGGVYAFGSAVPHGTLKGIGLNAPPFALWPTPTGAGYWVVAHDGGVFSFGDAHFFGSTGNLRLNKPVVGMAPTPDGGGYWLVAADGGIFTFGDARFFGSTGNLRLNKPIIAMAPTPGGGGYWLVASDGGVFSFGDATYQGSLPGSNVHEAAVAIAASPSGGYLVATAPGHVYGFGTAAAGGPAGSGAKAATVSLAFAR